jgi:hypothetical protein
MARKYIDCRDYPSADKQCTVALSADSEDEPHGQGSFQSGSSSMLLGSRTGTPFCSRRNRAITS